jgi:hypothetical protein
MKFRNSKAFTREQDIADQVHEILGLKKRRPYIYALASTLKFNKQDAYDMIYAAKQVKEKGLQGEQAYKYFLGFFKIYSKDNKKKKKTKKS